jgi:cation diffusion facilitator family transporter
MSGCECSVEVTDRSQAKVLIILLLINAAMFVIEISLGWWSESTALIADAMDMLADATVYGVAWYAVGRSVRAKSHAAMLGGVSETVLGMMVLLDIGRRIWFGSDPVSLLMISVGLLALVANVTCLLLLARHREGEVHMRASWIFSKNDVIANLGVVIGGLLVYLLHNRWPDILIGMAIAVVVIRGGLQIIKESRIAYAESA